MSCAINRLMQFAIYNYELIRIVLCSFFTF